MKPWWIGRDGQTERIAFAVELGFERTVAGFGEAYLHRGFSTISYSGKHVRNCSTAIRSSSRARCVPIQRWIPKPGPSRSAPRVHLVRPRSRGPTACKQNRPNSTRCCLKYRRYGAGAHLRNLQLRGCNTVVVSTRLLHQKGPFTGLTRDHGH